jgi:hypothetical protein
MKTDFLHEFDRYLTPLGLSQVMVDLKRFGNYRLHLHPGIKTRIRILEDDLYLAAQGAYPGSAQLCDILTVEYDPTSRGVDQPKNQATQGGLAAPGFAHEAETLSSLHRKGNAVNCPDPSLRPGKKTAAKRKMLCQIGNY